ncbi:MAG: hypothetical protein GOMPHAMPRED_005537 [Gomphillus americanus]|uniref:Uncharacterized protein n=1 Tax=Gomphillus americanus TaxID=1940652 RepID=A0A8H3FVG7_9LECA|nr:MAG: hypothetical protein GOMPHAMPRED_005537 [Gomphillus americanus]
MAKRPIFAILSLIFVAGAVLLEFFVILAGAINGNPINQVYFLEVDRSSAQDGSQLTHWTYWNSCQAAGGGLDTLCGVSPAYPFDPQNNFGGSQGIPAAFMGTNKFYYESRIMFGFAIVALVFSVGSLALGVLALCSRIGSFLSAITAFSAMIFQTAVAALMTAAFVEGRNIFNGNNQAASLGRYAFGFNWGAMAALFLASIMFCLGGTMSKDSSRRSKDAKNRGSFVNGETSSFTRA